MHIPQGETQTLDILSFEEASILSTSESYDRTHWIYVPDFYTEYRYVLGTRGKHPVICVGINPSTAEPDHLDPTLKSVARIAEGNGYDSWLMFNVYAQRATKPDDMDTVRNEKLHSENMQAFQKLLMMSSSKEEVPVIWAAWGAIIEKRSWLIDCIREMADLAAQFHSEWVCAGERSKAGHPHHPLYLKKTEHFRTFEIGEYLK